MERNGKMFKLTPNGLEITTNHQFPRHSIERGTVCFRVEVVFKRRVLTILTKTSSTNKLSPYAAFTLTMRYEVNIEAKKSIDIKRKTVWGGFHDGSCNITAKGEPSDDVLLDG